MDRRTVCLTGASAACAVAVWALYTRRRASVVFKANDDCEKQKTTSADLDLRSVSEGIVGLLKTREPQVVEGVPAELHWLPPHVPKKVSSQTGGLSWSLLGDLVVN